MRGLGIALLLFAVAACAPDAERAEKPSPTGGAVDVVNGLMAAFNDHDTDRMREYWHSDVTWIELAGDQSSVVTTNAQQLYDETAAYFEAFPNVQSSLENLTVNGNYVTGIERPVWEEDGERKTQASVVVYEVLDGKVKRFWYLPPQ